MTGPEHYREARKLLTAQPDYESFLCRGEPVRLLFDERGRAGAVMRVVRVIGVLEPGGAQLSALRLSRALAGFGIDSSLLLAGDATEAGIGVARPYGVTIEAFSPGEHRALQWRPDGAFVDWLRPRLVGADLVHAHMFGAWWAAAVALEGIGTPLVASEHNAVTWPHGDHSAAAKTAALRLAAFFAHGPAARAFAAALGLDPRSVHEGCSAVEGLDASPLPDLATPRITFTGRFREDKGPDVLVEALPLLASELGELPHCYLVGDGPMRAWLERRTHELGLAERVRFTGWSHEPARYVAGASVHVVPSREEAWSQSAVVAMGLGVPIVATAVEGLPSTLADGRGLLVAPEDPRALAAGIAGILRSEERTDLEGGRAYAARFEAGPVAEQYATIYRDVMRARRAG
jgi:glycosyltransferase involved in cell wall biosynthesis